eukprot:2660177-Prymnesium_polylepis.1
MGHAAPEVPYAIVEAFSARPTQDAPRPARAVAMHILLPRAPSGRGTGGARRERHGGRAHAMHRPPWPHAARGCRRPFGRGHGAPRRHALWQGEPLGQAAGDDVPLRLHRAKGQ